MRPTIPLVESVLVKGRELHKLGVHGRALELFQKLARFRSLREDIACETRRRLTHLQAKHQNLRKARRQLTVLLSQEPDNPHHHYRLARLIQADTDCDPRRATRHYRRALKLSPNNPRYLSAYGLALIRAGEYKRALFALRKAFQQSPESPLIFRRYLRGLMRMGHARRADTVLRGHRFRLGHEPWFQQLSQDFQFWLLHRRQKARRRRQAEAAAEQSPCLLPFLRVQDPEPLMEETPLVRFDAPSVLPAPHMPTPKVRPDRKRAQ